MTMEWLQFIGKMRRMAANHIPLAIMDAQASPVRSDPCPLMSRLQGSPWTVTTLVSLFLVLVLLFTARTLWQLDEQIRTELGGALSALNQSVTQSIGDSLQQGADELQIILNENQLQQQLMQLRDFTAPEALQAHPAQEAIREIFQSHALGLGTDRFSVLSPDGQVLADYNGTDIGSVHTLPQAYPDHFSDLQAGNPRFLPVRIHDDNGSTTAIIQHAAPVLDDGTLLGFAIIDINPAAEFTRITGGGAIGNTGENYVFDQEGRLLSVPQNFEASQPYAAGASAIGLRVAEPGQIASPDAAAPDANNENLPLTTMARQAIAGINGLDTEGYRDYRGTDVIGAWRWLPDYNIGLATEIDRAEAYLPYEQMYRTVLLPIAAIVTLAFGLILYIMRLEGRSRRKMESVVSQRTQDIRRQQNFLKSIIDNIPSAIILKDVDGRYISVNAHFERTTGHSASQILGRTDSEMLGPLVTDWIKTTDREVIVTGKPLNYRNSVPNSRGELRDYDIHKLPLRDEDGNIYAIIVVTTDITERNEVDRELRRTRERLDVLFKTLPVGVLVIEPDGAISQANAAATRILGQDYLDVRRRGLRPTKWQLIREDGSPKPEAELPSVRGLAGEVVIGETMGIVKPDKSVLWIRSSAAPLSESVGGGAAVSFEDITEQRNNEVRLRELSYNLERVTRNTPALLFDYVVEGQGQLRAIFVSPRCRELMELEPEQLLENPDILWQLVHPEDFARARRKIISSTSAGKPYEIELRIRTAKTGTARWLLVSSNQSRDLDDGAPIWSGVITDITARKAAEAELRQARLAAEEATRAKSDFLANMSHEIRTPMNAIIGMNHLALQTELNPQQRNYIEKAYQSAESLLGLINDILDFSKIEAGKMELERIDFDLELLMNNVASLLRQKVEEKNIELLFDLEPGLPTLLVGDPLRLSQTIVNLCSNAIKFTDDDGEVIVRIRHSQPQKRQLELQVSVQDNGIGMTPEQMKRLFQPFTQADSSTTRKHGGTGLGLAICKRLTQLMGGSIRAVSEYGNGSTFHFSAMLQVQKIPQAQDNILPAHLRPLRALVVDDNESSLEIHRRMLTAFGFEVDTCNDGAVAVQRVTTANQEDPYRLILIDWQMPGMNGCAASREIQHNRQITVQPEIILITHFDIEDIAGLCAEVDFSDLLTKPITSSTLFDTIMRCLAEEVAHRSRHRSDHRQEVEDAIAALQGARILLVEDNDVNQELAMELLTSNGLQPCLAENGLQALELLQRQEFDGVLMDIQMPVMDGYSAAREIRAQERYRDLPILAMTANALVGDREKSLAAGMNDHIPKPINVDDMFIRMARWIHPDPSRKQTSHSRKSAAETDGLLPELSSIDRERGLEIAMGNVNLYLKLLQKFRHTLQDFDKSFTRALEAGDRQECLRLVHSLKGSAGIVGAGSVQQQAQKLEAVSTTAEEGKLQQLFSELMALFPPILEDLSRLETTSADRVKSAEAFTPEDIISLLHELRPMLEAADTRSLDKVPQLERFNAATAHPKIRLLIKSLHEYDYERALALLDSVKADLDNR